MPSLTKTTFGAQWPRVIQWKCSSRYYYYYYYFPSPLTLHCVIFEKKLTMLKHFKKYMYYLRDCITKTPPGYPCLFLLYTVSLDLPPALLSLVLSLRKQSKN